MVFGLPRLDTIRGRKRFGSSLRWWTMTDQRMIRRGGITYVGCPLRIHLRDCDLAANEEMKQVIFKSKNPYNPSSWTKAVHFDFQGYDTSPFWDDNGKAYIVGAHAWRVSWVI